MEAELDSFQRQVAEKFSPWIGKLLDSFLSCQDEFRAIVFNHRSLIISKPPTDRLLSDYFERTVKALDVCNAIRYGIERIRQWRKLSDIVISALHSRRLIGEGQLRRAKKALVDLAIGMLDEKDQSSNASHRNRSFGRTKDNHNRSIVSRSLVERLEIVVSFKQLQALANNLTAPRQNDVAASNGLAVPVYTMASVLLFVMWVLVAAIPCQDRGLQVNFSVPRHYQWAVPVMSLHDRIVEESKRRDRKNCCGLLMEIDRIEKSSRVMSELVDSIRFPLSEEKEVHEVLKKGLDPFERKVREVFNRIVRSRTESLDSLC
ncbi:hypothetical protein Bca52824_096251 [Brassica carinata]|uniref:Uncharacterized protein n=1 Tax=Brassica carinata TaxID=52824 RepID=A0A8X7THF8_BRACI|nr:hypothetical protein Bca52824_096251 [Brassica carinata]